MCNYMPLYAYRITYGYTRLFLIISAAHTQPSYEIRELASKLHRIHPLHWRQAHTIGLKSWSAHQVHIHVRASVQPCLHMLSFHTFGQVDRCRWFANERIDVSVKIC